MDTFKTRTGKPVKVTPIKHGSMEIDFNGLIIQVDPVIDGTPPVTDYTAMAKADVIIVTHDHYDHLDVQAVNDLRKPSTIIVTNQLSAAALGEGEVMYNGDILKISDDIELAALPPGIRNSIPKVATMVLSCR